MPTVAFRKLNFGYEMSVEDKEFLAKILQAVAENGGPDTETVFFTDTELRGHDIIGHTNSGKPIWGDTFPYISEEAYREVSAGWTEYAEMDAWTVAQLFGYSAGDALSERGGL